MNSLQKQNLGPGPDSVEAYVAAFENSLLKMNDVREVELLFKKLQFLGINFDPFNQDPSHECYQVMEQLDLNQHMKNPYLATNILLKLLDKTEERLNNLKQ